MQVTYALLTKNEYSRPGRKLDRVLGVVMHWTANARADAMANRDYFEMRKAGTLGYGSAHYVVGQKGEVVQCVPETEIAYHCGSSQKDPMSGRVYTDGARARFGRYAEDPRLSPNLCTIGVELCPYDGAGNFTEWTLEGAAELVAGILGRHSLTADAITTHHDVVGWKDCPRLWTRRPELLDAFRGMVAEFMKKGE